MLILLVAAVAVLIAEVALPRPGRWALPAIALVGLLAAMAALWITHPTAREDVQHAFRLCLRFNGLTGLAHTVILATAAFLVLISPSYVAGRSIPRGEYYALLLLSTLGMMALASSSELLTLFLNFEILSIALLVLAGLEKESPKSTEAALKYFLLGAFASGFMLLGIAFIYGSTGLTRFSLIAEALAAGRIIEPVFLMVGLALLLVGFGFKLTLAPFHMYAPDVYDGAPTPIAAAIATGSKVAGFTALFHVIETVSSWAPIPSGLFVGFCVIIVASMVIGNAGAIIQPNIKRLLAYSSIAHSSYMAIPLVIVLIRPDLLSEARDALGYYLMAYALMTLMAFGVATSLGRLGEGRIASYTGLGLRCRAPAAIMALAMLSLIGLPPTVGFFGKVRLFYIAVIGGHAWLAVLGVLASVASAYYYLRVVVTMYMRDPSPEAAEQPVPSMATPNALVLTVGAVGLFVFAIFPWLFPFGT